MLGKIIMSANQNSLEMSNSNPSTLQFLRY